MSKARDDVGRRDQWAADTGPFALGLEQTDGAELELDPSV